MRTTFRRTTCSTIVHAIKNPGRRVVCNSRYYTQQSTKSLAISSKVLPDFPTSMKRDIRKDFTAVKITEVTLRDGLQNLPKPLLTYEKLLILRLIAIAGFPHIEVGSLVKGLPTVADTETLYQYLPKENSPTYDVLVPNSKGI